MDIIVTEQEGNGQAVYIRRLPLNSVQSFLSCRCPTGITPPLPGYNRMRVAVQRFPRPSAQTGGQPQVMMPVAVFLCQFHAVTQLREPRCKRGVLRGVFPLIRRRQRRIRRIRFVRHRTQHSGTARQKQLDTLRFCPRV